MLSWLVPRLLRYERSGVEIRNWLEEFHTKVEVLSLEHNGSLGVIREVIFSLFPCRQDRKKLVPLVPVVQGNKVI